MHEICIFGYPKSGTTWLCRLFAECISCPVAGYFGKRRISKEIAKEGQKRKSKYRVWKGHWTSDILHEARHVYKEVKPQKDNPKIALSLNQIVYIVRDVRDVICSGIPHLLSDYNMNSQDIRDKIDEFLQKVYQGEFFKSVVYGQSWDEHVKGWLERKIFYVRYEDLLDNPFCVLSNILKYLKIEQSQKMIENAIYNQSFDIKKNKLKGEKKKFLRKGQSFQYKTIFNLHQLKEAEILFGNTLKRLKYI